MLLNKLHVLFVFIIVIITYTSAASRPSYIKQCSRSDINFDKCALEHAKYAVPFITNGDKTLKIPNMKPLKIPLVELDAGGNLKLKVTDMEIFGLENTVPINITTDFNNKVVSITSRVDNVKITGNYEIKGKILVFPIEGKGPAHINLDGGVYKFIFYYDLVEKNGKQYAKVLKDKSVFEYSLTKVTYLFENLFNGDKVLGKEMNKFLNENWMEVDKDLRKPFVETLLVFYNDLADKIYSVIPYDELFLD